MKSINGFTAKTPQNLLLDSGAFYKGFVPGTDTPETASAKLMGATIGGGSFSAVPTIRQIQVDGGKTNVKGLETIDEWVVTMVINAKEVTADNLKTALGAAEVATDSNVTGYQKITAKADIGDDDYVESIAWVGTLKGSAKPVIIIIKNALSKNGLSLTFADKNEASIPITLTGNYSLEAIDVAPFEIYYPAPATA